MNSIDVLLLTGFLGSGKTTLLNHLLAMPELADKRIALIINEFGDLNVDARLVRDGDYCKYEINKGSIFCVCTKTAFIQAAQAIVSERPDLVIVEATGVAETADIEGFIRQALPDCPLKIKACLGVVDCTHFITLAATMKTAVNQAVCADGLILNKIDLAGPGLTEQVRQVVRRLNGRAEICAVENGAVSWSFIESLVHQSPEQGLLPCANNPIAAITLETDRPMSQERFDQWIQKRRNTILRLKGNVRFADESAFVEIAAHRSEYKKNLAALGPLTRLALITWKSDRERLQSEFEALAE